MDAEAEVYWERPLARSWATVISARARYDRNALGDDHLRAGGEVLFKRALLRSQASAVSAQFGPAYLDSPDARCRGWGGDVRLAAGRDFGRRAFANLEAGRKFAGDACGELSGEATLGLRLRRERLDLIQVFHHEAFDGGSTLGVQLSTLRETPGRLRLQTGLRAKTSETGAAEVYVVAALWRTR